MMKPSEKYAVLRAVIETRKPQTASDSDLKDYEVVIIELYDEVVRLEEKLEDKEHIQHKPECWKNQARSYLGVGGDLASCTCGAEDK